MARAMTRDELARLVDFPDSEDSLRLGEQLFKQAQVLAGTLPNELALDAVVHAMLMHWVTSHENAGCEPEDLRRFIDDMTRAFSIISAIGSRVRVEKGKPS